MAIGIYGQNVKPLRGFYAKIVLQNGDSIITEDNVLKAKTYPTVWYFAEIDSFHKTNNAKIGIDQTAKFFYSYKLYADYRQYWQFYNPYRLSYSKTHFETGWVDVMDGDGFSWELDIPAQMAFGIAAKLNIQVTQIQILNYYQ